MSSQAKQNSIQRWLLVAVVSLAFGALSVNARAACTLGKVAEFKVAMNAMTPAPERIAAKGADGNGGSVFSAFR